MLRLYEFSTQEEAIISAVYNQFLTEYDMLAYEVDVDITMLTREEMQELNASARGIDNATDVLSFPYAEVRLPFVKTDYPDDINPENGAVSLGEIMICREIMQEQALEYGHSTERECAYLVVHGLHHLIGYDHMNDDEQKLMRQGEEQVLERLNYTR